MTWKRLFAFYTEGGIKLFFLKNLLILTQKRNFVKNLSF